MARLTGGTVRYLQRVNTGNYEHKEASADMQWSAEDHDGADVAEAMMKKAATEARRVTWALLGIKAAT